jgi:hypothetical protein
MTCYFQRSADDINNMCPIPPRARPEGCPKREDDQVCCDS